MCYVRVCVLFIRVKRAVGRQLSKKEICDFSFLSLKFKARLRLKWVIGSHKGRKVTGWFRFVIFPFIGVIFQNNKNSGLPISCSAGRTHFTRTNTKSISLPKLAPLLHQLRSDQFCLSQKRADLKSIVIALISLIYPKPKKADIISIPRC
jgi:hypothetical protein